MGGTTQRTRKQRGGGAAKPPAGARVKRTVSLSADASRRLDVHATGTGQTIGAVVEGLVMGLRRFVLHDHGEARPEPAGEGSDAAA